MKKMILPIFVIVAGMAIAHIFFGVDIGGLFEGFLNLLADILDGPG